MNKSFKIYERRGRLDPEFVCEFTFQGEPQNGDRLDLIEVGKGVVVVTRRWTKHGELVLDIQRQGIQRC
jgi:hypothetical protein